MNDAQYAKARRNMVDSQILPNRVTDENVIAAMGSLPREMFLPAARQMLAYSDETVLIEDGRYLMQAMVLGRLLDVAEVKKSDVALAVGCGTGYGVAVLAKLVDTVIAIESDNSMRSKAERNLGELGIDNVAIVDGTLAEGHPKDAPYNLIYIDGAVPEVPEGIAKQLGDGGRLVCVEMQPGKPVGRGVLVTRFGDVVSKREIFDAVEPVLPGFEKEAVFSF
ncbi:protein-L-isoaspartate O-methyltransferase [Thalassospiraceae bacterium LMO-JJ14]|nr:protein-L-isoaspartate O-methyltransferase [Thalassospiraceae bacterium LMO-JJ14]